MFVINSFEKKKKRNVGMHFLLLGFTSVSVNSVPQSILHIFNLTELQLIITLLKYSLSQCSVSIQLLLIFANSFLQDIQLLQEIQLLQLTVHYCVKCIQLLQFFDLVITTLYLLSKNLPNWWFFSPPMVGCSHESVCFNDMLWTFKTKVNM